MADELIEPKNGATQTTTADLPDELLRLPTMQALMAGSPAAASAVLADFEKRPEGKLIAANRQPLQDSGFGFYRTIDGAVGVLFNQMYIHGEQIKQADQAGTLADIAPPFDSVASAVATSGESNPVMSAQTPAGFSSAPAPAAPVQLAGNSQPASVQNKTATARLRNLQPSSPTSGPAPGSGLIMRSILKPVV